MKSFVYISHAPKDGKYVDQLAHQLDDAGIRCWYGDGAQSDALSRDFAARALDTASAVIVVMTPASRESDQVEREIGRAKEQQKPIFPLLRRGQSFLELNDLEAEDVRRKAGQLGQSLLWKIYKTLAEAPTTDDVADELFAAPRRSSRPSGAAKTAVYILVGALALALGIGGTLLAQQWFKGSSGQTPDATPPVAMPTSTSPLPAGSARITSLSDGAKMDRCERISGSANLPAGTTLLIATRRVQPPVPATEHSYFFHIIEGYRGGTFPKVWNTFVYLGSVPSQNYEILLLIMDNDQAESLWQDNSRNGGAFGSLMKLPENVKITDKVHVRQATTTESC